MLKTNPFIFRVILLIGILIPCSNIIGQNTINVNYFDELQDEYIIDENLYIFEDTNCTIDIEKSISSSTDLTFLPFDKTQDLTLKSCHWIHFKIKSSQGFNHYFKDWTLYIGESDYASVFIVNQEGKIIENKNFGLWYPSSKKDNAINFKKQRVTVSFDPSEELDFYIKYQKKNNAKHVINIRLTKYDLYQSSSYLLSSLRDYLFLGFLFTMILLNFLFFYSTKYFAYLFHGLFILGLTLFLLDLYGLAFNLPIIAEHPFMVQILDMIGIGIADIAYFQFVRYYLNLNQLMPFWDKVLHKIVQIKFIFWPLLIAFYSITFNEPWTDKFLMVFLLLEYSIISFFSNF